MASNKNDLKWRKGYPQHVGWYNASRSRNSHTWRWFDGKVWSGYCNSDYDAVEAADRAQYPAYETDDKNRQIEYRLYYPKNARVPIHEARALPKPKAKNFNVVPLPVKAKLRVTA